MNKELQLKISSLPQELESSVSDFVDFLVAKYKQSKKKSTLPKKRKFGSSKGMFKMSKDFDEPLEDFKDYM